MWSLVFDNKKKIPGPGTLCRSLLITQLSLNSFFVFSLFLYFTNKSQYRLVLIPTLSCLTKDRNQRYVLCTESNEKRIKEDDRCILKVTGQFVAMKEKILFAHIVCPFNYVTNCPRLIVLRLNVHVTNCPATKCPCDELSCD